mmetsp:Transcript_113808/g.226502  ORF Transcript_113808/g.226502 Transcript_113808/m.226502 type:complete len:96 (-) Transcript_113808:232-519(-)
MLVNFIRCFEIRQDVKEVLKHNCTEWVYVHAAATAQKYADDTHSFFMLITQQLFSCPRHFRKFFLYRHLQRGRQACMIQQTCSMMKDDHPLSGGI